MREITAITAERVPSKPDRFQQVAMILLVFVIPLCFIGSGVIAYLLVSPD